MTFIPNYPSAAFADQAEPDSVDFDILLAGVAGNGVLSDCAVTAQGSPDMTVAVASGSIQYATATVSVSSGNLTIGAAHATLPRFDLITVNSSGTKAVTAGTASSNPVFPAIPANSIVLAAIYVPAADTDIDANQIIDKRVTVSTYSVPGITVYRCRLKRTVDSGSLTQSSVNYIAWDAEDYDTNTFHDNVTNNTRMTFTTTGLYQVNAFAYINGNATVILNIRKNGTTDIRATKIANGNPQGVGLSFLYDATATDYLEVGVNPSAVSCTVEADYSYFECFRVA